MSLLDRLEDEFVDVSTRRATLRELIELLLGSVVLVATVGALTWRVLGRSTGLVVVGLLSIVFAVTIASQAYWSLRGREDYRK